MTPSSASDLPQLGAQIWLEPGHSPMLVDRWFALLAETGFRCARVWIQWQHIEPSPGTEDFSLYDLAFAAAERNRIGIVATLTPGLGPVHQGYPALVQDDRLPASLDAFGKSCDYIARVTARYHGHPSLDTWLVLNEPGMAPRLDEFSAARFPGWLRGRYTEIGALNAAWHTRYPDFSALDPALAATPGFWTWPAAAIDWMTFWRAHLATVLGEWCEVIRTHSPGVAVHANPHDLVNNLATHSTDLPAWRPHLDSLGCSIHPAWHFGLLTLAQRDLGVLYCNALVRGASAVGAPYWVTELQAGNNIASARRPQCPSAEDMLRWTWLSLGAGAKRVIYWLLNARTATYESAEWSMLTFQNQPSDRLQALAEIPRLLEKHAGDWREARAIDAPVVIVLGLEAMTLQQHFGSDDVPGRDRLAHVREALACYTAFQSLGVPVELRHLQDLPSLAHAATAPRLFVLPHLAALDAAQAAALDALAQAGHTLFATGLTGFYDPHGLALPLTGFTLRDTFGAELTELRCIQEGTTLTLADPALSLPVHFQRGEILLHSATAWAEADGRVFASRNRRGPGEALWLPSLVGHGAWLDGAGPFTALLANLVSPFLDAAPFRFEHACVDLLLSVLQTPSGWITVLANSGDTATQAPLLAPAGSRPEVLCPAGHSDPAFVPARGVTVTRWLKQ